MTLVFVNNVQESEEDWGWDWEAICGGSIPKPRCTVVLVVTNSRKF